MVESVLLAACGGALGILFAYWGKDFLSWAPPSELIRLRPDLDLHVLGFTAATTALAGIFFGLLPGIRMTRVNAIDAIKKNNRTVAGSRSFLSKMLLVVQVAVSLILLIGAGLFTRTLANLQSTDVGFNTEQLIVFTVDPLPNKYSAPQIIDLYDRMIERIAAVPGIHSVTHSENALLSNNASSNSLFLPGQDDTVEPSDRNRVYTQAVRANFFDTMQIPVLRGRSLMSNDRRNTPMVAVINEALARRFSRMRTPSVSVFSWPRQQSGNRSGGCGTRHQIQKRAAETPPTVYFPYLQRQIGGVAFEVRTAEDPRGIMPLIRDAAREVDSNLPIIDITTQSQQLNDSLFGERLFAAFSSVFGGIALLLSCMGLYALMSYTVTRRTNEIGIRMALGAHRTNVLRLVMRETMLLVCIGVAIGIAGALAVTRLLKSMLYGLAPHDPVTILIAVTMLLAFATLAGYVPARRASKVDPMIALRYE